MSVLTRRHVLGLISGLTLVCVRTDQAWTQTPSRVVVVGGGFGGATCAKYLRRADPSLEVTLLEPHRQFVTCPFSNAVLVGLRDLASVTYNYDGLRQHSSVQVVHAAAIEGRDFDGEGPVTADAGRLLRERIESELAAVEPR